MKLKKIASLMLAGIMAVSMLAGCDGKGGSGQMAVEGKEDGNGAGSGVEAGDEVGYLFFHIGCSYWCDESSVFCRRKEGFLLFSRKNISGT